MRVRLSLNEEGDLPATISGYVGSGYSPQVGIEDIDGGHHAESSQAYEHEVQPEPESE